jgi:hypothetical protein
MDIGRAFSYIFDDQEWTAKLLITAILAFVGTITLPLLLVGLVAWAALLGYLVELIHNLRDNHPTPMPRWDNYGEKITRGGNVLVAVILYGLPNLLPLCCSLTTSVMGTNGFIGGTLQLIVLCCIFPLLLIYNLITWPMLALGLARYAEEGNIAVFFQFGDLFDTLYRNLGPTMQWIIFTLLVNVVFGIIGAIPCAGWLVAPALAIPIHGYLIAQFTGLIDIFPRAVRKR